MLQKRERNRIPLIEQAFIIGMILVFCLGIFVWLGGLTWIRTAEIISAHIASAMQE